MDAPFWNDRWNKNEIAFHQSEGNPLLPKHFKELALPKNARIFVPLCGKTGDLIWLHSRGYQVVGIEWVEAAIEQFYAEHGMTPTISQKNGSLTHYHAEHIDLFVGDVFDLKPETLGQVDAIYDRAALVALPEETRNHYAQHVMTITNHAPQLLLTFVYDQQEMEGPPFSISQEEVTRHYSKIYEPRLLETIEVPGGLKGKCSAQEQVWLLR